MLDCSNEVPTKVTPVAEVKGKEAITAPVAVPTEVIVTRAFIKTVFPICLYDPAADTVVGVPVCAVIVGVYEVHPVLSITAPLIDVAVATPSDGVVNDGETSGARVVSVGWT